MEIIERLQVLIGAIESHKERAPQPAQTAEPVERVETAVAVIPQPESAAESTEPKVLRTIPIAELLERSRARAAAASADEIPFRKAAPEEKNSDVAWQSDTFELTVPGGFHERWVWNGLLRSNTPFRGVVVVLGIHDYRYHQTSDPPEVFRGKMHSVEILIKAVMRDRDFACRTSDDEYAIVLPGVVALEAQKRMNVLSERLWDYQLRAVDGHVLMLSWGAVEVNGETLDEGAASAAERMYQSKRNRVVSEEGSGRRRVG